MGWKEIPPQKVKDLLIADLKIDILNQLLKNKTLLINSETPATISAISHELLNAFNNIKSKGIQPLFLGSKICDVEGDKSRLSMEFASQASTLKVPKITINAKAEQLFLYSRDVWSGSITKTEGEIKKGKIAFIYNEQGLFIGLAFPLVDDILHQENKTVLKNILDLGIYLRIEKH